MTINGAEPDRINRREKARLRKAKERARAGRGERFERILLREDEFAVPVPVTVIDALVDRGALREADVGNHAAIARALRTIFRHA